MFAVRDDHNPDRPGIGKFREVRRRPRAIWMPAGYRWASALEYDYFKSLGSRLNDVTQTLILFRQLKCSKSYEQFIPPLYLIGIVIRHVHVSVKEKCWRNNNLAGQYFKQKSNLSVKGLKRPMTRCTWIKTWQITINFFFQYYLNVLCDIFTWREWQNEFEIECVQLGNEEDEDDTQDGQPPLQRRQRVPRELDPAVRTKMSDFFFFFLDYFNKKTSHVSSDNHVD